jgi:hypothetical protein
MFETEENDLIKARPHKYIKRTGTPGNYRYWYKLADGRIVEGDDAQQKEGRKEHALRLLISRAKGKHNLSNEEIVRRTGYINDVGGDTEAKKRTAAMKRLTGQIEGFKKRAQQRSGSRDNWHTSGHDWTDEHLDTAHMDEKPDGTPIREEAPATPHRPRTRRPRTPAAPAVPAAEETQTFNGRTLRQVVDARGGYKIGRDVEGDGWFRVVSPAGRVLPAQYTETEAHEYVANQTATPVQEAIQRDISEVENRQELQRLSQQLQSQFGIDLGEPTSTSQSASEPSPEPAAPEQTPEPAQPAPARRPRRNRRSPAQAQPQQDETARISSLGEAAFRAGRFPIPAQDPNLMSELQNATFEDAMRKMTAWNEGFQRASQAPIADEEAVARAEEARAQAEQLAQTSGPDAPVAAEVHAADPILAQDDEPIRRMIESQNNGLNPHVERAREIFSRVAEHLDPHNRTGVSYFMSALKQAAQTKFGDNWTVGASIPEAEVKAIYNTKEGDKPTWSELKKILPSYKGIYHDMNELLTNSPLSPEVERMKRGYGRKQFERMKPFVKDSWHQSHPDAPPPYPTFGDLKTWNEHGHRPDWVSPRAQIAIPKEVHDAAPMVDGKVQLPPRWMPIHLMPIWNFAVKSSGRSDYEGQPNSNQVTGSGVNLPLQGDLRSHILNSIRKYVQGRGGIDQLVDIPASKMENGISHEEIFKSEGFDPHDMSDSAIKKIIRHKIIDPIAIAPYIKEELMSVNRPVKKSYDLVVDLNLSPVRFAMGGVVNKSEKSREDLIKAELIKKIKAKKTVIKALRIRG